MLLHRPSLVVADTLNNDMVQPEIKDSILRSVDKCMAAVDNVTILLKEIGTQVKLMPPFLTYLAYTVATVVVSTSFSPRVEEAQKAKQALGVYFQFLLVIKKIVLINYLPVPNTFNLFRMQETIGQWLISYIL